MISILNYIDEITYTSYIFAFGKHFASIKGIAGKSENITYFHYDNTGSTRVMTDKNGEKVFDQDYLPFGQNLPKSNQLKVYNEIGMKYKFTGQKEVASIGLYYYGAIYYDPGIGRFITEDTYRGELNNPQSQNLYVYVMNNPLKYVDPSGHNALKLDAGGGSSGTGSTGTSQGGINETSSEGITVDNNTDIESPIITIPALDYSGEYNEEIRNKLEDICSQDVVSFVDLASKTLDNEEFNAFVNHIFDRGGIVTPRDVEFGNTKDLQLKGMGIQVEVNIGPGTYGVEFVFYREEDLLGNLTGFNKENNVEIYVYGGGNISTSTMNEILTNTPRQFSSPEVSASMIAIYGDDIFVNPDIYQGGFQTGSVTIGYVKNSFATDLEGHINVIGVGGSFGGPIGGSAGLVTYTRVPQEKIFKHFSSENLDKAYGQVVNRIKRK